MIEPQGHGIFLDTSGPASPRVVDVGGIRLERFMDRIYVPAPMDELTVDQVSVVNGLRRELLLRVEVASTNSVVKGAFARAVPEAGEVLDWGCGYDTIGPLLPAGASVAGVDVDPAVVSWQRARGLDCYLIDRDLPRLRAVRVDVVTAVFVLHFRLTAAHASAMARVLRPGEYVLANVYRRTGRSRQRLLRTLEEGGLRVVRRPDARQLCLRHEFWAGSTSLSTGELGAILGRVQRTIGG